MSVTPETPVRQRGIIVVADDDIATRMLICRVLTRAAFTVYPVENGALACEAVRLRRPDLVLLDWMMPVMDGRRAVEVLKADLSTRAIPIVMLTTQARPEDRIVAREAGVQDLLTKPCDARELVACIDSQIRWRRIVAGDTLRIWAPEAHGRLIPLPARSWPAASSPDRSRPSARS